eukprot:6573875-Pyramimonas_sp.AAC.1
MQEMIVDFLIRMAFLTADRKDKEMLVLHGHTLELAADALDVWPTAAAKFSHMEKHVTTAAQQ